jgi:hypothetical protein
MKKERQDPSEQVVNRALFAGIFCMVLLAAGVLQSCSGPNTELDENLKKAVFMKYTHVANVKSFQNGGFQYQGVTNGSFFALFDVCSINITGSGITSLNYDTSKFFIDAGSGGLYGFTVPGYAGSAIVGRSDAQAFGAFTPEIVNAANNAFSLSPPTQVFPKQFYPTLKYRIAIFVKDNPAGYLGDSMTLKYAGQPQAAVSVENVSPGNPAFVPFYGPGSTAQIVGTCP